VNDVSKQVTGQFVSNPIPGFTGQCATGAQYLTGTMVNGKIHDSPSTPTWTKGAALSDITKPGTMVAWGWDKNGKYPNTSEGNHTAIYMGKDKNGNPVVAEQNVQSENNPEGAYQTRTLTPDDAARFHEVNSRQKHDKGKTDSKVTKKKNG